jgi:hypothetical protein
MAMHFGVGMFELLIMAAILMFIAVPVVIAGVILWIVSAGKRSGPKD